jgi:hypothetical protein
MFQSAILALFRPAQGVDGVADGLRWLWIPLALLLVISVAAKSSVGTPLSMEAQQKAAQEQMKEQLGENYEEVSGPKGAVESGPDGEPIEVVDAGSTIVSTSAMVFAVLGAVFSVVYVATFFFVAAKTWANPVGYIVMMSVASLCLVPIALRNLVQAAYMSATGTWLAHAGLGAMVAPAKLTDPPGVVYAFMSQVDLWVIWSLAILFGALMSQTVGIGRKRAASGLLAFVAITAVLRAVPTLVAGVFMGAM